MVRNASAFEEFAGIAAYLDERMPSPHEMRATIPRIVEESKTNSNAHMRYPEGAFLNTYIAPHLNGYLLEQMGLNADEACRSLLSESYESLGGISSASPARQEKHPFHKEMVGPASMLKIWHGEDLKKKEPATQPCPDLALRAPFPHACVVEGKYFVKETQRAAETELVKTIYEAAYYLGLPSLEETKTHPAWQYDYACVIAYDTSDTGVLIQAWRELDERVRSACWEGGNVYVMILPITEG